MKGASGTMPRLAGASHISLTVSNLERSKWFYAEVLRFSVIGEFEGEAAAVVYLVASRPTQCLVGLHMPNGGTRVEFSELNIGLDHFAFRVEARQDLEEWVERFDAQGVPYTPIVESEFGWHLNFRDPDNVPLELFAPNENAVRLMNSAPLDS